MQRLMEILQTLPQLGAMPGGPVIQTIGSGLAEELDMPDVISAIKKEIEMGAQKQEEQQKQAQMQQQLQIADQSAKHQLEAEKVSTKQFEAMAKVAAAIKPEPQKEAPAPQEPKGPSESIAFKDLPPEGQAQMAAQAGISLHPDHIRAEQDRQAMQEAQMEVLRAKLKPKQEPKDKKNV
jgi:hypothetical protein